MFKKSTSPERHINPRFRAFGKARIDIAMRSQNQDDWDRLWKPSIYPFPFRWQGRWKQSIVYRVDDFAAEVGFLIDVLGLPVIAFDANNAIFTSPDEAFTFAVVPTSPGVKSTPADAICIQFMVADLITLTRELESRGVQFEEQPFPLSEGSELYVSTFRTPHGITIELWGTPGMDDEQSAIDWDTVLSEDRAEPASQPEFITAASTAPPRRPASDARNKTGSDFRSGARHSARFKPSAPIQPAESSKMGLPKPIGLTESAPDTLSLVTQEYAQAATPNDRLESEYTEPEEAETDYEDTISHVPDYDQEELSSEEAEDIAESQQVNFLDPMDRFRGYRIRPRNQRRLSNE
jgi:hypothetical protein